MRSFVVALALLICSFDAYAQDTIVVQTLTFDSVGRSGTYLFPDASAGPFEKVLMQYTMRCKDGLISNSSNRNRGCGEWDYNCETYIVNNDRIDSVYNEWPSYIISQFSGSAFPYTTQQTYDLTRRARICAAYDNNKFLNRPIGMNETFQVAQPLHWKARTARAIYTYKAWELTAAGMTAGPIYSLAMTTATNPGSTIRDLRIRLRNQNAFGADTGWMQVYQSDYAVTSSPENRFNFYTPFNWTGGDVQIEISYTGSPNANFIEVKGDTTTAVSAQIATTDDRTLVFSGSQYLELDSSVFNEISNQVTIAFWAYAKSSESLPNSTAIEGKDKAGNRTFNVHLPWSDGQVYFDCGDATGYDRINKEVPVLARMGRWNHWAFTKNATTGKMSIYLNGKLFISDTGKRRGIDIEQLRFGTGLPDNYFNGNLRKLTIYKTELPVLEIERIAATDNYFGDPGAQVAIYPLNEGVGSQLKDLVTGESTALTGGAVWAEIRGFELQSNFNENSQRPAINLSQSAEVLAPVVSTEYTVDSLVTSPHLVRRYEIVRNDSVALVSTSYMHGAGKRYIYNEAGAIVDSFTIAAEGTLSIEQLPYYQKWPQKFEIMSFVTPYGIGLDLGDSGKMWEFDVTDYLPTLRNAKGLSVERGAWQEELDIRFLFIKGTPARNVIDIQQLWAVTEENYQTIQADRRFQPISVTPRADASAFKLRSMITGHGQEGEFIPRDHTLSVGETEYTRQVWKKCADNPIYPQGGTWIYDRAGWCPGAPTDLAEYELSIAPGVPVMVDYTVKTGGGDSRYVVSNQLVSYGAPNFTRDAAIVEVRRPSERIEFARINPACNEPIVVIRNNGSQPLTSVTISYSSTGGGERVYQWSGNLAFLQTAEVTLPIGNLSFWGTSEAGVFTVALSNPNGQQDEYAKNDTYASRYTLAPQFKNAVVLRFKSNKVPDENYYEIRDINGTLIHQNSGFDENTTHYDSLALPVGCYTLKFFDDGENGISFWAMPNDGNGTLALRQDTRNGKVLKQFEPDFGAYIQYDFAITSTSLSVDDRTSARSLSVYPNPASTVLNVDLSGYEGMGFSYRVLDVTGRAMIANTLESQQIDITQLAHGSYILELTTSEGSTHIPFVKE